MTGQKPRKEPGQYRVLLIITYAVALFLAIYKFDMIWRALTWVFRLLSPFFLGIAFAYLFHLPTRFFQYRVFKSFESAASRFKRKIWRGASMLLAYLCVFLAAGAALAVMLPRIVDSIVLLAENFPLYIQHFQAIMEKTLAAASLNAEVGGLIADLWQAGAELLQNGIAKTVAGLINFTLELTTGVANFFLALVLSCFMLYNRETLFGQLARLFDVLFGRGVTNALSHIARTVDEVFGRYLHGKLLEALILGCLTLIGMSLLGMAYAPLVSLIMAISSLIPMLGGLIGAIAAAFLLLIVDPMQALWFLIFITLLQAVEGNFIYPRVVGGSIGLSGLWTLLSIMVGGGLFGMWGMLLAPPVFAVLYRLLREWLQKKELRVLPDGKAKAHRRL